MREIGFYLIGIKVVTVLHSLKSKQKEICLFVFFPFKDFLNKLFLQGKKNNLGLSYATLGFSLS